MTALFVFVIGCEYGTTEPGSDPHAQVIPDSGEPASNAPESLWGEFHMRTLDADEGSDREYWMRGTDGERVILDVDDSFALRPGTVLEARGVRLDAQHLALSSYDLAPTPKRRDTPLRRAPSVQNLLVLLMEEANVTKDDVTEVTDTYRQFLAETTRNMDTLAGVQVRRYDIAYSQDDCLYDNNYKIAKTIIAAYQDDGGDVDEFEHVAVVVPRKCGQDWNGAWADTGAVHNDGRMRRERLSMYKDNAFDPWYLAHELGHNWGMAHSRSFDCGADLYREGGSDCHVREYGNYNDVMGWGEGVYWSTPNMRFLGWIAPERVVTAGSSDTFELYPSDASENCGLQALRVPLVEGKGEYLYVEYRRARPDSRYAGTGRLNSPRRSVVLITQSQDGRGNTSQNARLELGGDLYAGAEAGRIYKLPDGIAIEVKSVGGETATVKVTVPYDRPHRQDTGSPAERAASGHIGNDTCAQFEATCEEGQDQDKSAPHCLPTASAGTTQSCAEGDDCDGQRHADSSGDACPDDPDKNAPGACGCGFSDAPAALRVEFDDAPADASPEMLAVRAAMVNRTYDTQEQAAQHAKHLAFEELHRLKRRASRDREEQRALKPQLKATGKLAKSEGLHILKLLGAKVVPR